MKQQVKPATLVVAVVFALVLLGGLYYQFLGPGSAAGQSEVASPYGLPKPGEGFKTPSVQGSGINTITGEPLPPTAKNRTFQAGLSLTPPPGAKVETPKGDAPKGQPNSR